LFGLSYTSTVAFGQLLIIVLIEARKKVYNLNRDTASLEISHLRNLRLNINL
jgi:hypothetical protein